MSDEMAGFEKPEMRQNTTFGAHQLLERAEPERTRRPLFP